MRLWNDPLRRRWIVWGTLAVVFLLVNVYRLSTAVLADRLMVVFDTTGAQLGTLHASFFYIYALFQLPAGVLADRAGIRRSATAAAIVMNLAAVAFALSDTYLAAFASRALVGLGGSVMFVAILRFCANWFRADEFATMNGLTIAIAGLGGVVATTPLAIVVARVGWRNAIFGLGLIGLAFAGIVFLLARDTPESADLPPIEDVPSPPDVTLREVASNTETVLRDRETWLSCTIMFCGIGMITTLLGLWGVPYVVRIFGLSVTEASFYTLLGSVGMMVGPPSIGWLSDRTGRRTSLMVVGTALFTAAFSLVAILGTPPRVVVAFVYFAAAFLVGAFALGYTIVKNRHGSGSSGVATGTVNAAAFFGAALFPTLMGAALDTFWTGEVVAGARVYTVLGYRVAFAIAAGAGLIALLCSIGLHVRRSGDPG